MNSVLNKGLNFSVLPKKLDITQVLCDYEKFKRITIWKEFWYGVEETEEKKIPLFKVDKTNYPKNHTTPRGLITFLSSIKSEIMDPLNRNKVEPNLPPGEIEALKELVNLIKARKIVIKACDKGAGIMILDFEEYLRACYEHLNSTQEDENGEEHPYYLKVDAFEIVRTKRVIRNVLEEGLKNKTITKEEFNAMLGEDKEAANFYCNFKVHKKTRKIESSSTKTNYCRQRVSNV